MMACYAPTLINVESLHHGVERRRVCALLRGPRLPPCSPELIPVSMLEEADEPCGGTVGQSRPFQRGLADDGDDQMFPCAEDVVLPQLYERRDDRGV